MKLQSHRLADCFPLLRDAEFDALCQDIRKNGLRRAITLHDGKVLDGRNRYRACLKASVRPRFETYKGKDPLAFVVSQNIVHRHLTDSQRAILAADLLPRLEAEAKQRMRQGRAKLPDPKKQGRARDHAAAMFGVSARYIQDAKRILAEAPDVAKRVRDGSVRLVEANALLKLSSSRERLQILAAKDENPKLNVRIAAQAINKQRILKRATGLSTVAGTFDVLLIDPPWDSGIESQAKGLRYPTMSFDELKALSVRQKAAPNSAVFLWVTAPKLPEGIELLKSWGFEYVSNAVWVKDRIGLGRWLRSQHEILLIGKRGNISPVIAPPSTIEAPRLRHSEKPCEVYKLIESMFPGTRRLELFAREARKNWAAWGCEAPVLKARKTIAQAIAA
jgi:N6-adenosine-specific RNA methylase IME4